METLLSSLPAKRTILLDGNEDTGLVSAAFAQLISRKEREYHSRVQTGGAIAAIGAGTVVFGFVVKVLTILPCDLTHSHVHLLDDGTSGMSPEEQPRREKAQEQADAQDRAAREACNERSPGGPIMIGGGALLIGGLATLISASELSDELRDLKAKAKSSRLSIAPYIAPSTQANGLLVSLDF